MIQDNNWDREGDRLLHFFLLQLSPSAVFLFCFIFFVITTYNQFSFIFLENSQKVCFVQFLFSPKIHHGEVVCVLHIHTLYVMTS